MTNPTPLLRFENFGILDRESGRELCRSFSERLEAGSFLILTGPNGVGKSSTLRAIAEGHGTSVRTHGKIENLASRTFYHPQVTSSLFPIPITLGDVLSWSTHKIPDLIQGLDLDRPWNSASGGEKQRVLLSRMLGEAHTQDGLLLLDEPTNHLDSDSRQKLSEALESWLGTAGKSRAIVAVTHEPSVFKFGKMRELEEMK